MSTATVDQAANQVGMGEVLPIQAENKTFCRVAITKAVEVDGKTEYDTTRKVMSETEAEKVVAASNGDGTVQIEVTQTFAFDHGYTVEALQTLFDNDKELCKQTNNAIDLKLGNRARSLLLATDDEGKPTFEPSAEAMSLRKYIGQESATRGASVFEKVQAQITNLSESQRAALIAMLQAQPAQ